MQCNTRGKFNPHMQRPFNPDMQGKFSAQRGQYQSHLQMPAKELEKGGQVTLTQGNRRRPAMYDDTRKLDNTATETKTAETKELK